MWRHSPLILCLSGGDSLFLNPPSTPSGPAGGEAADHGLHEFLLYRSGRQLLHEACRPGGCRSGTHLYLFVLETNAVHAPSFERAGAMPCCLPPGISVQESVSQLGQL